MRSHYSLSWRAERLLISGDVKQSAGLDANGFFKSLLNLPNRRCVDFLRIAAGIYMIDRICKRRRRLDNESGSRDLDITFEVEDVDFWQRSDIAESVEEIVQFLTGDNFLPHFVKTESLPGHNSFNEVLDLESFKPSRIGMYSGGLDSAAGLAKRFLDGERFLLVTVDHQCGLHRRVRNQLKALSNILERNGLTKPDYQHSTLKASLSGGKSKHMGTQEKSQRSRAFLYCAAAAVAAYAYKVEVVEMFENGVGAINLPLMRGMLGNGLATRGSHPAFLQMMSNLSTEVADQAIRFALPFESVTKLEMVRALNGIDGMPEWAQTSKSCVHTSIRIKSKTHCGACPACVERRQAFRGAGVKEDIDMYVMDIFSDEIHKQDNVDYFNLYRLDAMDWIAGTDRPRRRLKEHLRLTGMPDQHLSNATDLQVRHAREIVGVFGSII